MAPLAQPETLTYLCPHCQAPVEVSPLAVGEPLKCPAPGCGQPFKAEPPPARPAPANGDGHGQALGPAAAPLAPEPESRPAVEREDTVALVKLSMWRRYPVRCALYVAAILASVAGAVALLGYGWPFAALLCATVGGLVLARFCTWWARMHFTMLTITDRRVILEMGVIQREATELRRDQVGELQVLQDLLRRWTNAGDIILTSSTGDRKRLVVMAVPDPERVADLIRQPRVVASEAAAPSVGAQTVA